MRVGSFAGIPGAPPLLAWRERAQPSPKRAALFLAGRARGPPHALENIVPAVGAFCLAFRQRGSPMSTESSAGRWVEEVADLTRPQRVEWCDGSKQEYDRLVDEMLRDGTLLPLNSRTFPGCYLHRSHPSDVARTEQLTFICTTDRAAAGPTNNWMPPAEARERVGALLRGSMAGRRMFVVPYLMGPVGSPLSRVGLMVTDSPYVVASMHIMTRVGRVALEQMRHDDDFVGGIHSLGDLSPDRRFVLHFPEERRIWSVGSGYGGNALLGKKCHALRIASWDARQEGWMAEHMLILGVEDPDGEITYLAAAMPSASGKTNLAMVVSSLPGYRVWTVGDDIAWIHVDPERPVPRREPGARLLRGGTRHERPHQPERDGHGAVEHDLHQRGPHARRRALVGGG